MRAEKLASSKLEGFGVTGDGVCAGPNESEELERTSCGAVDDENDEKLDVREWDDECDEEKVCAIGETSRRGTFVWILRAGTGSSLSNEMRQPWQSCPCILE